LAYVEPFAGNTHRLVRSKYVDNDDGLMDIDLGTKEMAAITALDSATNQRALAEQNFGVGIGPGELIYGVPDARLINASFTHTSPHGNRFNDRTRGAWYAGATLSVSQSEVAYHQQRLLTDARVMEDAPVPYVDLESDFNCDFHRLDALEHKACLQPEPVPQCYGPGQTLAHTLMFNEQSNGIAYNSVRSQNGTCIVCFRPVLVYPIRRGARLQLEMQIGRPWRWSEP
jgi:hypothetical protein